MSRLFRSLRLVVPAVALMILGFTAGVAAQGAPWSQPGDPVVTAADADRAIAWWRGDGGAASFDPATLAEANDRIWLAMGQIVDDLMGLDLRTRGAGGDGLTVRSTVNNVVMGGDGFVVMTAMCDPGEQVTGGGYDIPGFDGDGLDEGEAAVIPQTSYPVDDAGVAGWAIRVSRVPDDPVAWAPITVYAVCAG